MKSKIYYVYEILVDDVRRYVGITDNIKRRQSQHRRDLKKGGKYLYKMIAENSPETIISLNVIKEFNDKGDCSRWECKIILDDYFNEKKLWQSFPISIKYF
jgi:predicted GIY-YIG superfamily endonuclease